jgi:type II secretory pathway component PulJ
MRKEVLLAILIGSGLGLLITFAVYQNRRNVSEAQKDQVQEVLNNTTDNDEVDNSQLAITSPEDNLIVDSQRLIVSGNTQANNFVVIFVNNEEVITNADESGNFSKEVRLNQGANVLVIYAINQDGLVCQNTRTVIVDADFLSEDFSDSAADKETADTDQVESNQEENEEK